MDVRRAVVADVAELSKLVLHAKAHWGYSNAQLQAWRASLEISAESIVAHPTFVGELNGLLIGFYSLIPSAAAWDLNDLWVLPAFMKKGVGRELLMHAVHTAALGGATSILIESDPNAEPFYLACGAQRIGEVAAPIAGESQRIRPLLTLDIERSNIDEPVEIVEYDSFWPTLFNIERDRIAASLSPICGDLEHIGSTAVPGLSGKPIIDIMLGVRSWPLPEAVVRAITKLGYEYLGEGGVAERLYFRRRGSTNFNVHGVRLGGAHWVVNIALREYLRSDEKARQRYGAAKHAAIAAGATTLLAYSRSKANAMATLLTEARGRHKGSQS